MSSESLQRIAPEVAIEPQPTELRHGPVEGYSIALPNEHTSFRDLLRILLKHKWAVGVSVVIMLVLATVATLKMTPLYEATGRIAINRQNPDFMGLGEVGMGAEDVWDFDIVLETNVRVLQSSTLALQVIKQLDLHQKSPFREALEKVNRGDEAERASPIPGEFTAAEQHALIRTFDKNLKIATVPKTRVVEIRFFSPDPVLSSEVVNTLTAAFVEHNFRAKFDSTTQASEFLTQQIVELQTAVETTQERLVRYQKEHDIVGIDDKQNLITTKLNELNQQLTGVQAERIAKEAHYRTVAAADEETLAIVTQSSLLQRLREQQAELQNQYAQASTRFGPSYPLVQELQNQLQQAESGIHAEAAKIRERARNDFQTVRERERMLSAALDRQKEEANRLNESAIQYNILQRELATNRDLYETMMKRLKEAGVAAGLRSNNVSIVDPARVPAKPARPIVPLNLALGLFLGLAGGIGLAFAMESLDASVQTAEEIQSLTGLPALGIVPLVAGPSAQKKGRRALASAENRAEHVGIASSLRPKSELAESFRAIRTSLLLSSSGRPPKVIMVTSSLPQEGKTTVSINTAVVLSQRVAQTGGRVLLVDADMRRPSIHSIFGLKKGLGLSSVLAGSAAFDECITSPPDLTNVDVLTAGPNPPYPAELLGSSTMVECLAAWRERYDHIVIDTPPVLSVTDAVLLSPEVDNVLLVVRSGKTTKYAVRRTRAVLGQVSARVAGVVVNGVDLHARGSYYGYGGYGYGYRYYGSYYEEEPEKS